MKSLPTAAGADWYHITDWQMETSCHYCGMPLLVEDQVLEAYDEYFYSVSCAWDHHPPT